MNDLSPPALAVKSSLCKDLSSERDWLLSSLRTAATRSRLRTSLLETIHVALRQKRVDCAGAVKCPKCGGDDRFSINTAKQVFDCRGCGKGGDVIALVQLLDCADFKSACATLTSQPPPKTKLGHATEPREVEQRVGVAAPGSRAHRRIAFCLTPEKLIAAALRTSPRRTVQSASNAEPGKHGGQFRIGLAKRRRLGTMAAKGGARSCFALHFLHCNK
jgi:hypothetical protein